MDKQIPLPAEARADEHVEGSVHVLLNDVAYQRLAIVNIQFVGLQKARDGDWVLVDAGLTGTAGTIRRAAHHRFGENSRPKAIVLTHGHFDHVGALVELADEWNVNVYAHPLEAPYLDGRTLYPPPDTDANGGIMPTLARFLPRDSVDISKRLHPLPDDGSIPFMDGWRWMHTPGHTPGHVSLWRERDRTLIAGDAFITTRQESAYAIATQALEMHGPPRYFTPDWTSARESVQELARLEPEIVVTGHGRAMQGQIMRDALQKLANNFDQIALPDHLQHHGDGR